MENQLFLNVLISLIIGVSISYYYFKKINSKFYLYSFIIFILSFTILFYLGPKNTIESFHSDEECKPCDDGSDEEDNKFDEENNILNEESELVEENYDLYEENILNEENQEEDYNQEEILENQEEYIKQSIEEEEIEEEDNNDDLKKKIAKKKLLENNLFNKAISGNNNQFNPGIGVGISPVNIYINGDDISVDKFKNNRNNNRNNNSNNNSNNNNNGQQCNDNYFKNASRIYNNCDWIKDKKEWCDGTYNYDNNCNMNNNLLPCNQPEATRIPQTLNNLVNSKKTIKNSEPCPLDVNKPWSIYKTGDDKETNEIIPEGFNL